jgi:integrase
MGNKTAEGTLVTPESFRNYLSFLANRQHVSASTQNQAFSAILFLCREILNLDPVFLEQGLRAKRGIKLPVVLSVDEVTRLLKNLIGQAQLMAQVIFGGSLRVMECCRLRVKDIDFENNLLFVRDGKGSKDRSTRLAGAVCEPLRNHLKEIRVLFEKDRSAIIAGVWMPDALDRKYPYPRGQGFAPPGDQSLGFFILESAVGSRTQRDPTARVWPPTSPA